MYLFTYLLIDLLIYLFIVVKTDLPVVELPGTKQMVSKDTMALTDMHFTGTKKRNQKYLIDNS